MKTGAFWRNINPHRRTTPARVVKGLGAGALAGAALVTGAYALMFLSAGSLAYFPLLLLVFPVALVVWAVGLCAFAGPGWWILHMIGARSPFASMAYGGTLCTLLGMAVALLLPLSIAPADQGHKVLSTPITETGWYH